MAKTSTLHSIIAKSQQQIAAKRKNLAKKKIIQEVASAKVSLVQSKRNSRDKNYTSGKKKRDRLISHLKSKSKSSMSLNEIVNKIRN